MLTLNVGLSKQVGSPNYGSRGASCNLAVELDARLLLQQGDQFHHQVQQAYSACEQAVQNELARQLGGSSSAPLLTNEPHSGNGRANNQANIRQQELKRASQIRRATSSQVHAIEVIARRQQLDIGRLVQERFSAGELSALSVHQASGLIDELQTAGNGSGGSHD